MSIVVLNTKKINKQTIVFPLPIEFYRMDYEKQLQIIMHYNMSIYYIFENSK